MVGTFDEGSEMGEIGQGEIGQGEIARQSKCLPLSKLQP
jgi:hypothetical protein